MQASVFQATSAGELRGSILDLAYTDAAGAYDAPDPTWSPRRSSSGTGPRAASSEGVRGRLPVLQPPRMSCARAFSSRLQHRRSRGVRAQVDADVRIQLGFASERVVQYPAARSADSSRISPVPSSCGAFGSRAARPSSSRRRPTGPASPSPPRSSTGPTACRPPARSGRSAPARRLGRARCRSRLTAEGSPARALRQRVLPPQPLDARRRGPRSRSPCAASG